LQNAKCKLKISRRAGQVLRALPVRFFNLQFAICNLQFAICLIALALLPATAAAADSFPRGPGLYFNPIKLVLLLAAFLVWVKICAWVNEDAKRLELPQHTWNLLVCGGGFLGLLLVWALPLFWLSLLLLLGLYVSPTLAYVNLRNQQVEDEDKVLTEYHLRLVAARLLRTRPPRKKTKDAEELPKLRFLGKSSGQRGEEDQRVARAASSQGYKGAVQMVHEAIKMRATDIHMEPTRDEMTVRYRVDGILRPAESFSRAMGDGVINIFKVLADMDITEKRKPQDGSFSAEMNKRTIDFRVATAGSVAGEKLVMRILDKSKALVDLTQLGMRDRLRDQVHEIVTQPHGMILVCGPTGAGKSTTLYACLNEIDRFQKNVITVENPVEYHVSNVTQIEINPKAGKTFAGELRSILRQDPDVIMIGEIRDQETADIACQAAQTGHMVFTTLHANDSVTALLRLIDLGVQPFSIASAVSGVLSQRLVRLLCSKCKVRYRPNPDMLRKANLPADKIKYFYRPPEDADREDDEVCPHCGGTGYRGRTGIFELLVVNDALRELVRANPNANAIKQEAIKTGMKHLQEDGLRQVIEGRTSIQELLRVCK